MCIEEGARLFSLVLRDSTGGNRHKLKRRKICPDIRKHFVTVRVIYPLGQAAQR